MASPQKYSLDSLKNFWSRTVTDVPMVDKDWGFLLGEITITGISSE